MPRALRGLRSPSRRAGEHFIGREERNPSEMARGAARGAGEELGTTHPSPPQTAFLALMPLGLLQRATGARGPGRTAPSSGEAI